MKRSLLLIFLVLAGPVIRAQTESLICIENAGTRVGILSEVGGRIVYLSKQGSENLLKSDPALWIEDEAVRPEAEAFAPWKTYNGHIVWNGPQSEWWIHQDVNPERKKSGAIWPPDPYLIYGNYKVLEKCGNAVRLKGPVSAVSGLSLEKYIEIGEDGSVYFEVTGTNTRNSGIAWDLWLNTRVDGYSRAYVAVDSEKDVRIKSGRNENADTVKWEISNHYFHYLPEDPPKGKSIRSSKAYITPATYQISAFLSDHCLMIRFPAEDPDRVHPEQAVVEIYNSTTGNPDDALLELEFHAPYTFLAPGESMKTWEKWEIKEYKGENSPADHIKFLNEVLP